MATLLHESKVVKLIALSLTVFLVACTTNQRYKRQVSGDESYLNTPALKNLTIPQGMSLPLQNGEYDIPPANQNGAVGKALDIRPPIQPLSLLSDTHTENSLTASRLFLSNTVENSALWSQINAILQQKAIKIRQKNDSDHFLITDWITWPRGDEDIPLQTRQKIQLDAQNTQIVITVTNEGIKQGDEQITDAAEIQRYNILMLNELIDSINKLRNTATSSDTQGRYAIIDVQTGSDSSGLPQIIVRAPYDVVWDRLPSVLESIGMQVGDRSRSTGAINLTYNGMSDSDWQAIGVDNPTMAKGDYKLQVGDMNNRSSLQFMAVKGTTLTQKQNDEMVSALKTAFSKVSSN
ncbi:outer membrane protein assembly factor BamC [Arsenophonus apicola]|uniref:Outer membrane protein assembly factor BamC n=1 Tax=Arsenophonus apicola TaxID=2879119 RepID=A0ABY8P674_9GAMM|nr:outer membrane protein assembly factor BamC [Arsenophonus apicola]WGO84742.1 outer membrane protein assembly factor BamC [Arsenophonus apicola]